ncbi:MAG: glycosyltransferase [Chloroflexi bacterium]|nr:glycosyltransferase [Chloroflexota bacterium]MBI3762254.1 glycosyltransferase [Chloroflexota bacterium]
MSKRILVLFSDTGGGHRSSAEAIREALLANYAGQCEVELVDLFVEYMPYPFRRFPAWYPWMVKRPRVWGRGFKLSDGPRRSRALATALWPVVRRAIKRLVREHPADVVVSVHPLFQVPLLRAFGKQRPPYITVVTDLVSTHAWWYHPKVDRCLVPTEPARERAVACGMPLAKVRVVGLPVADRFSRPAGEKADLRAQLNWHANLPAVLVVGGGEGMGPLFEIARGVASAGLRCQLAVVAGRNEALRQRLSAVNWEVPTHLYGFVRNMPELMGAADLIVTKAGPSSIVEAFNAGRPLILSSAIPGQEEGNVRYVVSEGAGLWAPGPAKVVEAVRSLLSDGPGEALSRAAANSRRLASPHAAADIAAEVAQYAGMTRAEPSAECSNA